jgi:hypothetical protein
MKRELSLFILAVLSLNIFAQSEDLVARYTFEDNSLANEVNASVTGNLSNRGNGTLPTFETGRDGTVVHLSFGAINNESYVTFPNPLQGINNLPGATVSLWVNRLDDNVWDAIWVFLDNNNRFYLTPNAYLGLANNGQWFDCNYPEGEHDRPSITTNAIAVDAWNMVTVTANTTGFAIYVNGVKKYDKTNYGTFEGSNDATNFSYTAIIDLLKAAPYFYLGYGSFWGSAELLIDDLSIYKRVLTDTEIAALYNSDDPNPVGTTPLDHNRHHEFTPGDGEEDSGNSYFYYFYNREEHDRVPDMDPVEVERKKVQITIDGVSKHVYEGNRFVAEGENNTIPSNISISLNDESEHGTLIANPLMSHLDFGKLLEDNSSVIEPYFRLWNGSALYTVAIEGSNVLTTDYNSSSGATGSAADLLIAPMQSFFVEKKGESANLTIIPDNVSTVKAGGAVLRSATPPAEGLLKVIARSSGKGSSVVIKRSENQDEYNIPKVFTFLQEVPELYIVDEQAIEIKGMDKSHNSVPLALRALDGAEISLTFAGLNTLTESVSLYDAKENRTVSLSETANMYSLTNDVAFNNRLLLLFAPSGPVDVKSLSGDDLLVLNKRDRVQIVSSPLDRIQSVKIYNLQGQLITENNNLSAVVFDIPINGKGVYIVDVVTEHLRSIKKIVNY